MVLTRSMSKTNSTTAVRAANKQTRKKARKNDSTTAVRAANKQTRKKARKNDGGYLVLPIDIEAMSNFLFDYIDRHRHRDSNLDIDALDDAGQNEWAQMSALEKEPYIKTVMERREERLRHRHWH